jgi:hypothetical protein
MKFGLRDFSPFQRARAGDSVVQGVFGRDDHRLAMGGQWLNPSQSRQ